MPMQLLKNDSLNAPEPVFFLLFLKNKKKRKITGYPLFKKKTVV